MELRPAKELCPVADEDLDPELLNRKRNGFTICGLPIGTIMLLKMCMVLTPMQRIMSVCKHGGASTSPRQALRAIVFDNYHRAHAQQIPNAVMQPGPSVPLPEEPSTKAKPARKRTRKPPASNPNGATGGSKKTKANANIQPMSNGPVMPPLPTQPPFPVNHNFNAMPYSHEVLVVSEPSMMGNDFGESDERAISRVENAQYDQMVAMNNPNLIDSGNLMGNVGPSSMNPGHIMPPPPIGS